jgi:hypothetical protein
MSAAAAAPDLAEHVRRGRHLGAERRIGEHQLGGARPAQRLGVEHERVAHQFLGFARRAGHSSLRVAKRPLDRRRKVGSLIEAIDRSRAKLGQQLVDRRRRAQPHGRTPPLVEVSNGATRGQAVGA